MADALHQRAASVFDDLGDQRVAGFTVFRCHLHLDQLVAFEHIFQLGHERRRDALAAGLQQCFEIMGLAAQETVLGGG